MQQSYGPEWQVLVWILTIGGSLVAAVLVGRRTAHRRWSSLPPHHVGAATIIALIGWETAVFLPGVFAAVSATYAGIENAPGQGVYQLFAATQPVLVVAAAAASLGLLRRRPWAAVLGIGLCIGAIVQTAMGVAQLITMSAQFGGDPNLGLFAINSVASGIPPIVAIVLLVLPITGGSLSLESTRPPAQPPAREEEIGIIGSQATAGDRP